MKQLLREYEFNSEQKAAAGEIARRFRLTQTTAEILLSRGMDTEEKVSAFLNPSRRHFLSPFLMKGMKEAVELITTARDEGWSVAVFGDYDADGIGACAVRNRCVYLRSRALAGLRHERAGNRLYLR